MDPVQLNQDGRAPASPSEAEASAGASAAASDQATPASVVLVHGPLSSWPLRLISQLTGAPPQALETLDAQLPQAASLCLLGYSDPAAGLAQELACNDDADVVVVLDRWRQGCERMLELRRRQPGDCLLINLSRLTASSEAELLNRLGIPGGAADNDQPPLPAAVEAIPALPAVVENYLTQRSDLIQLLADLEGCSELLGREPECHSRPTVLRGLPLAERLLEQWSLERSLQRQQSSAMAVQLETLRGEFGAMEQERNQLREELSQSQAEMASTTAANQDLSRQLEQLRETLTANGERIEEQEARLQDGEEEKELILLQCKQIQDELTHHFQQLQQTRLENEDLAQRLAELEQESRYLFLHSRLNNDIEQSRIETILSLMRSSLQP